MSSRAAPQEVAPGKRTDRLSYVLKVGMDHTSTAPVNITLLSDLPVDILKLINEKTVYCDGPLFHVQWTKSVRGRGRGSIINYVIHGFPHGMPSDEIVSIKDVLNRYMEHIFNKDTGLDLVWNQLFFDPTQISHPNKIPSITRHFVTSSNISTTKFNEWANSATNGMISDLDYTLETSSAHSTAHSEPLFQQDVFKFDICTHQAKRLEWVLRLRQ